MERLSGVARRVLLFILVGAAINGAVIVALALTVNPIAIFSFPDVGRAGPVMWSIHRFDSFGTTHLRSTVSTTSTWPDNGGAARRLPSWTPTLWTAASHPREAIETLEDFEARGWPLRSAWCRIGRSKTVAAAAGPTIQTTPHSGGIETEATWTTTYVGFGERRYIPLEPIWSGWLVNSAFYATIAAACAGAARTSRSAIRLRRGSCPSCGHGMPAGPLRVCPECGRPTLAAARVDPRGAAVANRRHWIASLGAGALSAIVAGAALNALVVIALSATTNQFEGFATTSMSSRDGFTFDLNRTRRPCGEHVMTQIRTGQSGNSSIKPASIIPAWLPTEAAFPPLVAPALQRIQNFEARGFPMLCAWCRVTRQEHPAVDGDHDAPDGGVSLLLPHWRASPWQQVPRVVPLRPIWRGLTVNTALYAVICAAAWCWFGAWRRVRTDRRHAESAA